MNQAVQTIGNYTKRDISPKDKYVDEACTASLSSHPFPLRQMYYHHIYSQNNQNKTEIKTSA